MNKTSRSGFPLFDEDRTSAYAVGTEIQIVQMTARMENRTLVPTAFQKAAARSRSTSVSGWTTSDERYLEKVIREG
jgi:hypothetical protein